MSSTEPRCLALFKVLSRPPGIVGALATVLLATGGSADHLETNPSQATTMDGQNRRKK